MEPGELDALLLSLTVKLRTNMHRKSTRYQPEVVHSTTCMATRVSRSPLLFIAPSHTRSQSQLPSHLRTAITPSQHDCLCRRYRSIARANVVSSSVYPPGLSPVSSQPIDQTGATPPRCSSCTRHGATLPIPILHGYSISCTW